MGVHGITTLLKEKGFLPTLNNPNNQSKTTCSCSIHVFKEWNPFQSFLNKSNNYAERQNEEAMLLMTKIPSNSLFLIDGNGLAFYLHQIAYARYIRQLGSKNTKETTACCCPLINTFNSTEIIQSLPCMLPLDILKEVTIEFVTLLRNSNIKLKVFWDGPKVRQRFKTVTTLKRNARRQEEFANLQQFCLHGILPTKQQQHVCQLSYQFPYSSLFLYCVKHTLGVIAFVDMINCKEEADIELAKQATNNPNSYVIGQDSDFFFYKDIQYIPLDSICISSSGGGNSSNIHGFVGTRSNLAKQLNLEDSQMTELAILLGNDYVEKSVLKTPTFMKHPQQIIDFLQDQDNEDDYQVEATDEESQRALEFVRCLYDLHNDMDDRFPLTDDYHTAISNTTTDGGEVILLDKIQRLISFPNDFPKKLLKVSKDDKLAVRDVLIRCLQVYIDQNEADEKESVVTFKQVHLQAYKTMLLSMNTSTTSQSNKTNNLHSSPPPSVQLRPQQDRPEWNDIKVAYFIESCILKILKASGESLLARVTSPNQLFNQIKYYNILSTLRQQNDKTYFSTTTATTSFFPLANNNYNNNNYDDDDDDAGDILAGTIVDDDTEVVVENVQLPIDDHRDNILQTIQNNRVTIIHGETGCGKSSRVPIMILEASPPEPSLGEVKFFISQPRRIAAKALVERVRSCEPKHKNKFALRMGHGWREYETNKTQAWFVTTGYLTRLLANHPERFDDCSHLIIDEVHERSVDTDILCLLCRRLLIRNTKIRLVLMSATLATKLYQDYFNVPNEPIHVGVRRFPIQEFFVEDLLNFNLPPSEVKSVLAIQKECENKRCNDPPSAMELSKRFQLAARVTAIVGQPGSAVLIFVPGMNEIVSITECIETSSYSVAGVRYTCFPIHSDIPFDDQMDAFKAPEQDEVKVIIATNAAESSVTLPNVDHVICLGLCRQIMYNESSHRQVLTPCWISRASATQRAGRTGRVRPGNVYRLYTRHAYESYMDEFEPGEMVRIPLDAVILMLKEMLHEEVKPVLMNCIEPPSMDTIDRSFYSLYRWNFITEPDDLADITTMGSFVSALGIDLSLGSLIGLGIQFGVAAEAIEMAAAMSFPKTPFQITNPLFHDPATFNEITSHAYVSKCHFDANLYSEPFALMNALWDYDAVSNKRHWSIYYRFAISRLQQLVSTRNSLRKRVADFMGINEDKLQVECPPVHMPEAKLTILRMLQVWVFSDTIVECQPTKLKTANKNGWVSLSITEGGSEELNEEHLSQVLDPERHPHKIVSYKDIEQRGDFDKVGDHAFDLVKFMSQKFEAPMISYMCETQIDLTCCYDKGNFFLYVNDEKSFGDTIQTLLDEVTRYGSESLIQADHNPSIKRRGVLERKCGLWSVSEAGTARQSEAVADQKRLKKIHINDMHGDYSFVHTLCTLADQALSEGEVNALMEWEFPTNKKKKKKKHHDEQQEFCLILRGMGCVAVPKQDMLDMLGRGANSVVRKNKTAKSISFQHTPHSPFPYSKSKDILAVETETDLSSWNRTLFQDIPEGARILSVLASGQRRGGHKIRFTPIGDALNPEDTVDIGLNKGETEITRRWRRLGSESFVYVQQDTVPASATHSSQILFACCSNALEIRGGGLKVEGLTLLPPDPLFLLLSLLSFGLEPGIPFEWTVTHDQKELEEDAQVKKARNALLWLRERKYHSEDPDDVLSRESEAKNRVQMALSFHESCSEMGETLVCFTDKVQSLCSLFDVVFGDLSPWETLQEKALTLDNLKKWRHEKKTTLKHVAKQPKLNLPTTQKSTRSSIGKTTSPTPHQNQQNLPPQQEHQNSLNVGPSNTNDGSGKLVNQGKKKVELKTKKAEDVEDAANRNTSKKWHILRTFTEDIVKQSRQWFATDLQQGQQLSLAEFPATNILSLLCQVYSDQLLKEIGLLDYLQDEKKASVTLNSENWEILTFTSSKGKTFYFARFSNDTIPVIPIVGRGKNKLPKWMKKHMRPNSFEDAKSCVPPDVSCPRIEFGPFANSRKSLMFDSVKSALQMEAAFWLERQFCSAGKSSIRHWYDHNFDEMVEKLRKHVLSTQGMSST